MRAETFLIAFLASFMASALASEPPQLHVQGNRIVDNRGRPVLLRGVNAASLEWSSIGEGHILQTVDEAVRGWHANVVRIPVCQDRWFGKTPEQNDAGAAYRSLVKRVIDRITSLGAYAIFDLHWSDAGVWGRDIGQHVMPDQNSVTFWHAAAPVFRNDPGVILDLYNEPHDTSWEVWRNGGTVREKGSGYEAVGMQTLLDTIRREGAQNMVLAGGLDWAYDISGPLGGFALSDPHGHGVVYANHSYPFKGDPISSWLSKMEAATQRFPVIVSEFGTDPPKPDPSGRIDPEWLPKTLQILHDHRWNWVAWDLHPAASPCLISDWNYKPTPWFGVLVKQELSEPLSP